MGIAVIDMRRMKDNEVGTIAAVKASGQLDRRIRDIGLVPGTDIKILGGHFYMILWPSGYWNLLFGFMKNGYVH